MKLLRGGGLGVLLTVLAFTVAVDSRTPSPDASGMLGSRTADSIQCLWSQTSERSGGYGAVRSFLDTHLYTTAWSLRLLGLSAAPLPDELDRSLTAESLRRVLEDPALEKQLPPLEVARLAAQALRDLGISVPQVPVRKVLDSAFDGSGYRFLADETTSWSAASVALMLADLAELGLPPDHLQGLRVSLASATPPDASEPLETAAWVWVSTRIEPGAVSPRLVSPALTDAWTRFTSHPAPSGDVIAAARQIREAARAIGVDLPPLRNDAADLLRVPDGLALTPGGPMDPQLTAYAVEMGLVTSPEPGCAGPAGWIPVASPDPESSLFAYLVLQAMGEPVDRESLASLTQEWIDGLSRVQDIPDARSIRARFYVSALARELGLEVSPADWARKLSVAQVATWTSNELVWLIRSDAIEPLPLTSDVRDAVQAIDGAPIETMGDALRNGLAGRALGRADLTESAESGLETFRLADSAYVWAPGAPGPDLFSLAVAAAVAGETADARVLSLFSSAYGPTMVPLSGDPAATSNLTSAFLALVAIDPDRYGPLLPLPGG